MRPDDALDDFRDNEIATPIRNIDARRLKRKKFLGEPVQGQSDGQNQPQPGRQMPRHGPAQTDKRRDDRDKGECKRGIPPARGIKLEQFDIEGPVSGAGRR